MRAKLRREGASYAATVAGDTARLDARPRSADSTILGIVLTVFGVFWLLRETGAWTPSWRLVLSSTLVLLGLGLLATIRSRGRSWMIPAGIGITAWLMISSVPVHEYRAGELTFRPQTIAGGEHFRAAAGEMTIDLTDIAPGGTTGRTVEASLRVGKLMVIVPRGLDVEIDARARVGRISIFGTVAADGIGADRTYDADPSAPADLVLDLRIGAGEIDVVQGLAPGDLGPGIGSVPMLPREPDAPFDPTAPTMLR